MTNDLNCLTAISPIDGRYADTTKPLQNYFSEYAYLKTCVEIELKYLVFLSQLNICRSLTEKEKIFIERVYSDFTVENADELKKKGAPDGLRIHDLKSVEYYLKRVFQSSSLTNLTNWIHFGITSCDIIDNAYRLMISRALKKVILPELENLVSQINRLAKENLELPMLGRTHGQPAVPTTFGKEMAIFSTRINKELNNLGNTKLYGKFGGAVGNWNALKFAFPNKDWPAISTKFIKTLGLNRSKVTTQIAPPEDIIAIFQSLLRINNILIDFNQDIWRYISDDWIVQKGKEKDVGSSTMPQKVNPIEFENSEGNLVIANGLFETFVRKLPISRLQRDLSDSTVLRNIGVVFAHSLIAYKSCLKGIQTISPNKEKILEDLNEDWSILSEALQTILRMEGKTDAYECVAAQIRGKKLSRNDWLKMINSLDISKQSKNKLKILTPENYTGITLNKW